MSNSLNIGTARIDITPPVGVTLWGYNPRTSTSVEHPLRAEALACGAEEGGWLLLTADVGAFNILLSDRVRKTVAERLGLPVSAIMLAATHTHSGPHVTDALWREQSELESGYFRDLADRLVDVAVSAWGARATGELLVGQASAPELCSNRRIQLEDGTWTNRFRDPEGSNPGYADPTADLLGVRRPDGTLEALLVSFGCHPVAYSGANLGISGDYVSYMKDALEASGQVRTSHITVSGHANIDPVNGCQADPAVVRDIGERLAAHILEALPTLKPLAGRAVAGASEPWSFTTTWALDGRMAIYFPYAQQGKQVQTALSGLRVGDLAIVGAPGEVVSEYRAMIRERSPFAHTFLFSVVNDFIGYIPTDEIQEQGAYEANISPLRPMQAAFLDRVDALLHELQKAPIHS